MTIQDKINLFINRAQTKISELSTTVASDLSEAFVDSANIDLAIELVDAIESLQSETLQWTNYEKELVVDYYSYKAKLSDIAIVNYSEYVNNIAGNSTSNSAWVAPFTALTQKVNANYQEFLGEIARLDTKINNLDLSTLIPQYLLDEINANTIARHAHNNKAILDQITLGNLQDITNNTDHRNNSSIHVTPVQKQNWDAKATVQQLLDGLTGKADASHTHLMSHITGLVEALNSLQPQKGDKGDQGNSPRIILGTVTTGPSLSITINDSDPLNVIFNFIIPEGKDGKNFKIEVFGAAAGRLSTLYNNVIEGYTYLGTDNGYLYFRKPFDSLGNAIPATTTTGWTSTKFLGSNGWSPVIGLLEVNDTLVVQVLKGWTGGTDAETKPTIGSDPSYLVYLGSNGFTYSLEEAVNVKGSQGIAGPQGKIMFPDASGIYTDRTIYDNSIKDFIFLDAETGIIYKKLSNVSGDWSSGYQWKGDKGNQGEPGATGVGEVTQEELDLEISNRTAGINNLQYQIFDIRENSPLDVVRFFTRVQEILSGQTVYLSSETKGTNAALNITQAVTGTDRATATVIAKFAGDTPLLVTRELPAQNTLLFLRLNKNNTARTVFIYVEFYDYSATGVLTLKGTTSDIAIRDTVDTYNILLQIEAYIAQIGARSWIEIKSYQTGSGVAAQTTLNIEGDYYSRFQYRIPAGSLSFLDDKVISTQDLPSIGSLSGETQKQVNAKMASKFGTLAPILVNPFSPSIVFDAKEKYSTVYTQTAQIAFTFSGSYGYGASYFVRIISNGNAIILPTNSVANSYRYDFQGVVGVYDFYFLVSTDNKVVVTSINVTAEYNLIRLATPILSLSQTAQTQVTLTWTASANNSGYLIEKNSGTGYVTLLTAGSGTSTYVDTAVSVGVTYQYRIKALGDNISYSDSLYDIAQITTVSLDGVIPAMNFSGITYDSGLDRYNGTGALGACYGIRQAPDAGDCYVLANVDQGGGGNRIGIDQDGSFEPYTVMNYAAAQIGSTLPASVNFYQAGAQTGGTISGIDAYRIRRVGTAVFGDTKSGTIWTQRVAFPTASSGNMYSKIQTYNASYISGVRCNQQV